MRIDDNQATNFRRCCYHNIWSEGSFRSNGHKYWGIFRTQSKLVVNKAGARKRCPEDGKAKPGSYPSRTKKEDDLPCRLPRSVLGETTSSVAGHSALICFRGYMIDAGPSARTLKAVMHVTNEWNCQWGIFGSTWVKGISHALSCSSDSDSSANVAKFEMSSGRRRVGWLHFGCLLPKAAPLK